MKDEEAIRQASLVKDKVEVDGVTYEVRKLSWRSLQKAALAKQIAQASHMRAMGGEIFRAIASETGGEAAQRREAKLKTREGLLDERYAAYDEEEILVAGLERVNGRAATRDFVCNELDKKPAEIVFRRIVDLSCGPIDEAQEEHVEGKS